MRSLVAVIIVGAALAAHAEGVHAAPRVEVCELLKCRDGVDSLSPRERATLALLEAAAPAGVTEEAVSSKLPQKPGSKSDPLHPIGSPEGTSMYRVAYWTSDERADDASPHVDVYFWNGRVVMLQWWYERLQKQVQVMYVD